MTKLAIVLAAVLAIGGFAASSAEAHRYHARHHGYHHHHHKHAGHHHHRYRHYSHRPHRYYSRHYGRATSDYYHRSRMLVGTR